MYAIYDLKDNENCLGIFDSAEDVAKYFGVSRNSIYISLHNHRARDKRYLIEKIMKER